MRTSVIKTIANPSEVKTQLLHWSQQFREAVFLDSHNTSQKYNSFDAALAVDALTSLKTDALHAFEELKQYQQVTKDWLFGYFSYDLKNALEDLKSENHDGLEFPDLFFFQPKKVIVLRGNQLEFHYLYFCEEDLEPDFKEILSTTQKLETKAQKPKESLEIKARVTKEAYHTKINTLIEHIHRGDLYEANFCMEFYAEKAKIDPVAIYEALDAISEPPFASFFKNNTHFLLCASPERYLKKEGTKIISQPIKGTAKRFKDTHSDKVSRDTLENTPKERSENIMIVDLVRNDLSKTATKGSVQVEELCGIYSFKQVHQMISTVVSEVESHTSPIDIIKTTFPMGSMTGAPKISAMQIIEQLEETKRGLYSGALGYFTPSNDFDFNVVIRSILYNAKNEYLSFSVGSAITTLSQPEKEYEECLLKAKAMLEVLQTN